jgi:DNA-binding transcriptional MerR regulator
MTMPYTIQEIAKLAGVSLRTLRFYDNAGLLHPKARSEAGYRLYSMENLETLQQILFFRELDFPLKKIGQILAEPGFDREAALKLQIGDLKKKAERYGKLAKLAEKTLKNMKGGDTMEDKEMFAGFGYDQMMQDQKKYENEVQERWGNTEAYRVSRERTSKYNKEDWAKISAAQEADLRELVACYQANEPPESTRTQAVADKMRRFIDENFYPCSKEMFGCLGEMYVQDERFKAFYDKFADGLAEYYNNAIRHYVKNG